MGASRTSGHSAFLTRKVGLKTRYQKTNVLGGGGVNKMGHRRLVRRGNEQTSTGVRNLRMRPNEVHFTAQTGRGQGYMESSGVLSSALERQPRGMPINAHYLSVFRSYLKPVSVVEAEHLPFPL